MAPTENPSAALRHPSNKPHGTPRDVIRARIRAQSRARSALVEQFRVEYENYYQEERQINPRIDRATAAQRARTRLVARHVTDYRDAYENQLRIEGLRGTKNAPMRGAVEQMMEMLIEA